MAYQIRVSENLPLSSSLPAGRSFLNKRGYEDYEARTNYRKNFSVIKTKFRDPKLKLIAISLRKCEKLRNQVGPL